MAVTRRQYASSGEADPASATFASTPLETSLLVATSMERAGTGESSQTISGSGWTKRVSVDVLLGDADYRRSLSGWTKIAGASEPTNIQVDDGTLNSKQLLIEEYAGDAGETFTFLEAAENDNGGVADATNLATGTTASVSTQDLLVIGLLSVKVYSTSAPSPTSWSDSLTGAIDTGTPVSWGQYLASAYKTVAGGSGTYSATGTHSAANNGGLTAGILVVGVESGVPPPPAPTLFNIATPRWRS